MDRAETRLDLRPLDMPALLDGAMELYRSRFLLFSGIMAVTYVPFGLVTLLASAFGDMVYMAVLWLGLPILMVAWPIQLGALLYAGAMACLGRTAGVIEAYRAALRRAVPLLVTGLLMAMLVGVGFVFLIVPGLVLTVTTTFALHAAMLEDTAYDRALARSFQLTRLDWPRVLGLHLAMWLLQAVLVSIPTGLMVVLIADPDLLNAANSAWTTLSSSLVIPLYSLPFLTLYLDIRIRREALDLRLLADRLGPRAAPS